MWMSSTSKEANVCSFTDELPGLICFPTSWQLHAYGLTDELLPMLIPLKAVKYSQFGRWIIAKVN